MNDLSNPTLVLERELLGALLLDARAVELVMDRLSGEHFSGYRERQIYEAYCEVVRSGQPLEILPVVAAGRGKFDATHVAEVSMLAFTAASAAWYADEVIEAGQRRMLRERLAKISTMVQDPNTSLEQAWAELEAARTGTEPAAAGDPRPLWEAMPDHLQTVERRQAGDRWSISSGLPWIDRMTGGWHRGEFIVVGGASSSGKSVLGLQFARTAAMQGRRVLYVLLEMTTEQMIDRVIASVAGVNYRHLADGRMNQHEWKAVLDTAGLIHEQRVHLVIDDRCPATLSAITQRARRSARNGLDMVVVDYVGEVAEDSARQTRVEHVGRVAEGLKSLAKQLNIPVIALAQLNREAGNGRPSFQYHLGESKKLGDAADVALLIWRKNRLDEEGRQAPEETIELGVDKQRNGPVGWSQFTLVGAQMTVREPSTMVMSSTSAPKLVAANGSNGNGSNGHHRADLDG